MLRQAIQRNSIVLGLFATITATLLATTHLGTADKIADAERHAAQKALLEIVPREQHDNDLLLDTVPIPRAFWATLGLRGNDSAAGEFNVHVARQHGTPVAILVPAVAADGYSGPIRLIIGIYMDGTVAGVRVRSHTETPGLGDKIDLKKHPWILSFNGKSLNNPLADGWRVKKDQGTFDQFTGATITPRAVVAQVYATLEYFAQDRGRLLAELTHARLSPAGQKERGETRADQIDITDPVLNNAPDQEHNIDGR